MTMKIKPDDIRVPCDEPFRHDLLDREKTVQTLTNLLHNLETPYTLSIDAPWGNGKTTFLNLWKQHLRIQGFPVVSFNAWETDFAESPLVALSSELLETLENLDDVPRPELSVLKKATRNVLRFFLSTNSLSLIPVISYLASIQLDDSMLATIVEAISTATTAANVIDSTDDEPQVPPEPFTYLETKSAIESFRCALLDTAGSISRSGKHNDKPLIIAIDELDRCRPSYAVELLEIAKHLFSVDKIVFVLAIDKTQLAHSIRALYGDEFDSIGYLRRFIDLDFRLPDPNRTDFIVSSLNSAGILSRLEQYRVPYHGAAEEVRHLLTAFLNLPSFSLRRIQQAVLRLGLVLHSIDSPSHFSFPATTLMMILRTIDTNVYYEFIRSNMTGKEVADHVFNLPELQSIKWTASAALFEALLIIADDEFRSRLHTQSRPVQNVLYDDHIYTLEKDEPDPLVRLHSSRVIQHYKNHNTLHQQSMESHATGFRFATQQIEFIYSLTNENL